MASRITNDVLAAKLDASMQRLEKVELKVDALPTTIDHKYVSHDYFELKIKEIEASISNTKLAIAKLENKKTFLNWLVPTLSAVAGSVLTFLLIEYIRSAR